MKKKFIIAPLWLLGETVVAKAIVDAKHFLKYCETFAEEPNALVAINISEIRKSFKLF